MSDNESLRVTRRHSKIFFSALRHFVWVRRTPIQWHDVCITIWLHDWRVLCIVSVGNRGDFLLLPTEGGSLQNELAWKYAWSVWKYGVCGNVCERLMYAIFGFLSKLQIFFRAKLLLRHFSIFGTHKSAEIRLREKCPFAKPYTCTMFYCVFKLFTPLEITLPNPSWAPE